MKTINDIFPDLGKVLMEAMEPVRQYQKTSDNVYKPEHARFKLAIYFKDGNTRYYYSYDNKNYEKERIIDETEGLKKLIRLIDKYQGRYKNAIVYATLDPGKPTISNYNCEIIKYNIYGVSQTNKFVNFTVDGKNVIFDFKRIEYLQKFKI